eukprot:PLAT3880.1.p1 GENE.PLAT3880.1~~PLAT3880.1.p1  ORF type:complete len:699 (-),score=476.43 PLAT3880.1:78-2174(-)
MHSWQKRPAVKSAQSTRPSRRESTSAAGRPVVDSGSSKPRGGSSSVRSSTSSRAVLQWVHFGQLTASISVTWPLTSLGISQLFRALASFINLSLQLAGPECAGLPPNLFALLAVTLAGAVLLPVLSAVLWALAYLVVVCVARRPASKLATFNTRLVRLNVELAMLLFVPISTKLAEVFACKAPAPGQPPQLLSDPTIICYTSDAWLALVPLAVAAMALLLATVAMLAAIYWRMRKLDVADEAKLHELDARFIHRAGFIIGHYRTGMGWWELLELGKKLLAVALATLLVEQPTVVAYCMTVLLLLLLPLQLLLQPFQSKALNRLQTGLLATAAVLTASGGLLREADSVFDALLIALSLATLPALLAVMWLTRRTKAQLRALQHRKSLSLSTTKRHRVLRRKASALDDAQQQPRVLLASRAAGCSGHLLLYGGACASIAGAVVAFLLQPRLSQQPSAAARLQFSVAAVLSLAAILYGMMLGARSLRAQGANVYKVRTPPSTGRRVLNSAALLAVLAAACMTMLTSAAAWLQGAALRGVPPAEQDALLASRCLLWLPLQVVAVVAVLAHTLLQRRAMVRAWQQQQATLFDMREASRRAPGLSRVDVEEEEQAGGIEMVVNPVSKVPEARLMSQRGGTAADLLAAMEQEKEKEKVRKKEKHKADKAERKRKKQEEKKRMKERKKLGLEMEDDADWKKTIDKF